MEEPDNKPTTLEERLTGALISAVAMAFTIAALSFVLFIVAAKGRYAGTQLFFEVVFSKASLFVIAAAAVLGFTLSFDKMLLIFSTLWGTNTETEFFAQNKLPMWLVLALAVGVAVVLLVRQ